jgi:mono/diheme cytochrome c family protein
MSRHYFAAVSLSYLLAAALGGTGALAGDPPRVGGAASKEITYSRQVARIIQRRCQSCHHPDAVAPFALTTYEQAKTWSKTIRQVVATRRMPPWHADPRYGHFTNDRSLTQAEIDTLVSWVDHGAPQGSKRDLPPPASFPTGWTIGKPDAVIRMPEDFVVPAEGVIDYQRFTVPTPFKDDVWVERCEAKPGCRAVHHILVYVLQPGKPLYDLAGNNSVLCGTAPGDMPTIFSPGMAKKIPAGASLLFEVHYTPTGKVERDRSSVGVIFAKQPPKQEVKTNILVKQGIRIPPGESNHREEQTFSFPQDIRVISFMPHMHIRGSSWEYRLLSPDGRVETLLSVPKYDFNWQSVYRFADPPIIPRGAKLLCIATWDNSKNNPANPDPTKEVTWGPQTWDEMMNGWMDYVVM